MSQRSIAPNHAVFVPRPPLQRPVARTHARPMAVSPLPRPAVSRHARPIERSGQKGPALATRARARATGPAMRRRPVPVRRRQAATFEALGQVAIIVCALGVLFVTVMLGLLALLQHIVHQGVIQSVFPLLLGGTLLILLRGQVSLAGYRALRRRVGLTGAQWPDHALTALYGLAFFFAAAVIATLLAAGAAAMIGALLSL